MHEIKFIQPNIFWYVVGYIATDGSLSKDGRHIVITSKDRDHIKKIKSVLGVTSNICMKTNGSNKEKKYAVLQIGSIEFYKFLNSIGIHTRKSLNLGKLTIPREYFLDFLRGVIDGDGCIHQWQNRTNSHTQWALRIYSGALQFTTWLKLGIEENFFVAGKVYTQEPRDKNRAPMHIIKFGKIAAQKIIQTVYYKNCFCLKRKLTIVNQCLRDSSKMLNYGGVLRPGGEIGYTRGT
jgi:hypothetical protein